MIPFVCLILGLVASGFFSGIETGFYRVPRIRIVLDSLEKSKSMRVWFWFINRPAAFVSTVLIGNNIANYAVSLGLVGVANIWFGDSGNGQSFAVLLPVLATPFIFVYGELVPKLLFFRIPARLLSLCTWPFFIVSILLLPASLLLFGLNRLVQHFTGTRFLRIQADLGRKELQDVLAESQAAGVLSSLQQSLSQNMLANSATPIVKLCISPRLYSSVSSNASRSEMQTVFAKTKQPFVLVKTPNTTHCIGYLRAIDLMLNAQTPIPHPLPTFEDTTPQIEVLTKLVTEGCELAQVIRPGGEMIGIVTTRRLLTLATTHK